jgi:DNA repair protein RadA/Sms
MSGKFNLPIVVSLRNDCVDVNRQWETPRVRSRRQRAEVGPGPLGQLWLVLILLGSVVLICPEPSYGLVLRKFTFSTPWNRMHFVQSIRCRASSRNEDEPDDDDDEPPSVDVSSFRPPNMASTFGLNRGRSSPSQRKAMGTSGSSTARIHICGNCGSEFVKWMGRCPTCREWNTLQEHAVRREPASASRPVFDTNSASSGARPASWLDGIPGSLGSNAPVRITDLVSSDDGSTNTLSRLHSSQRVTIPNDDELNVVLGGGIMPGSLNLIGGDPGVGKSTLMLQIAGAVASLAIPTPGIGMGLPDSNNTRTKSSTDGTGGPVWYVSGEENPDQIASRASRLGILQSELWLLGETHVDTLCQQVVVHVEASTTRPFVPSDSKLAIDNENVSHSQGMPIPKAPALIVIDSIQTMVCDSGGSSSAGGITQVRECVALLLRLAKSTRIPIFLVGHVTKTGDVAGPRTVEHMVDCVLYLEGSAHNDGLNLRMLRASKNRFGSSDEVGVYEMTAGRLLPVSDPSSLFLAHRVTQEDAEGCAIAIALEGMRAMTVEVQALATPSGSTTGYGRRTVEGIAMSRLNLLIGVLQKRCGVFMFKQDVYINVAGRIRLDRGEGNAADLGVAVALVSSLATIAVRSDTAFVGEVGLLGELRSVAALPKRLAEARRMGFSRVITPRDGKDAKQRSKVVSKNLNGVEWIQCSSLLDAINAGLVQPLPKRKRRTNKTSVREQNTSAYPERLEDLGLPELLDDGDDDAFM